MFLQQILCGKLLLVLIKTTTLNYALKKQQTKNQQKKIMHETVNFCSLNLTKPKKKSKNTANCHNLIFYYFISTYKKLTPQ